MIVQVPRHIGLMSAEKTSAGTWDCVFGFATKTTKFLELDSDALALLEFCFKPRSIDEIAAKFSTSLDKAALYAQSLMQAGVLKECAELKDEWKRYDRHVLFYEQSHLGGIQAQERLSKSKICLIGMGGIGNWVAMNLIGLGLEEIRFVDFDNIELTNLTRQILFDEKSIGKSKVSVAAEVLSARNSQTKLTPINAQADSVESVTAWIQGCDVVVLSADRPAEIHVWVDAACVRLGIPYVNIGYKDNLGIVGPFTIPGLTSCYQCFKPKDYESKRGSLESTDILKKWDTRYQAPSFGPLNALVSTVGATEVIKSICAKDKLVSLDTELSIDPFTLEISKKKYRRDPNCWHCSTIS